jgi:hypothetical protein
MGDERQGDTGRISGAGEVKGALKVFISTHDWSSWTSTHSTKTSNSGGNSNTTSNSGARNK